MSADEGECYECRDREFRKRLEADPDECLSDIMTPQAQLELQRPVVDAAVAWVEWRGAQSFPSSYVTPPLVQALLDAVAEWKKAQKGGSDVT